MNRIKTPEPLQWTEMEDKKSKMKADLYNLMIQSIEPKRYYTDNSEELKELLSTVEKISLDIETDYPGIVDGSLENYCINLTNFSWANSIKFVLHFTNGDFIGKFNTNDISFKGDKIDQVIIDLYLPDKEDDFYIHGTAIIKHSLFYLFQLYNTHNVGEEYSYKELEEIVKNEEKIQRENFPKEKIHDKNKFIFTYQLDNYFKLAYTINFLCRILNTKKLQSSLKATYQYNIDSYIETSKLLEGYDYYGSQTSHDMSCALEFLRSVVALSNKAEREECESKLKKLIGKEIETILGIKSNEPKYLYFILKKFYQENFDFNEHLERLEFFMSEEIKEIKRDLLKNRNMIQKTMSDNGIVEFKSKYFYNIKNQELEEKYYNWYNSMVELGIQKEFLETFYTGLKPKFYDSFQDFIGAFFDENYRRPLYIY